MLLLAACSVSPRPRSITEGPTFERGFQIFPSPRTFDPPGTIFRVDNDGVRLPVADLSGMLTLTPQDEVIPTIAVRGKFDAGVFFSWLSGKFRAVEHHRVDSATVVVSGAKRERAFEANLKPVLDSAAHVVDWSQQGRVYLIVETVLADSVEINVSTTVVTTIGDSLKSDSARAHGIAVEWQPSAATRIALRFSRPHRIFYKVIHLVRRSPLEPDSLPRLLGVPVDTGLVWYDLPISR